MARDCSIQPSDDLPHLTHAYSAHLDDHEHEDEPDEDDDGAQYAMPMDDPYAEVEHGWRRMSEASAASSIAPSSRRQSDVSSRWPALATVRNEEVLDQLSGFTFGNPQPSSKPPLILKQAPSARKLSLPPALSSHSHSGPMNLSMQRSDQSNLFKPPTSAVPTKSTFSTTDLVINQSLTHRSRMTSFSTELEPISGSPTSPNTPTTFSSSPSVPSTHTPSPVSGLWRKPRASLPASHYPSPPLSWKSRQDFLSQPVPSPPSASSSSFCSSSDDCLLRRASTSSLASVGSVASSTNGSATGLKARRGLTKPLSLAVPSSNLSAAIGNPATSIRTALSPSRLQPSSNGVPSSAFRSLPPSPRLIASDHGHTRDQIVGMKANVTGSLSMKRRTSIPRLSLGGISSHPPLLDNNRRRSLAVTTSTDYVRLLGRNLERSDSMAATPLRLHFDPVAAAEGKQELMSSQAGVGGKGHIERPPPEADGQPAEEFPYQNGPREVLPGLFLGSEQNARDPDLLRRMGFGCVVNVAKEVECPWTSAAPSPQSTPAPGPEDPASTSTQRALATPPRLQLPSNGRTLLVRPTASTPNLHRSFKNPLDSFKASSPSSMTRPGPLSGEIAWRFEADQANGRPALEYRKLPWSHDEDGLAGGAFDGAFEAIDRAIASGTRTLVHCQCGVSRSATLVIGYCMRRSVMDGGQPGMHQAYTFVKEKSPWAGPNMVSSRCYSSYVVILLTSASLFLLIQGLIYQLIEYEKVLRKKSKSIVDEVQEEEEEEEEDGARTPTRGE